ncbi:MAG TPA: hypothetical protein VGI20_01720 [Rhizomicrobium sp.]|jgi:hypothetical protein
MWRHIRAPTIVIASLVLLRPQSASAFDLDHAINDLATAKSCCATIGDLKAEPLVINQTRSFGIDNSSQVFDFGGNDGLSFAYAFQLPATNQDYTVTVRSENIPNNPVIVTHSYFFYPIVTILDEAKKVIRETNLGEIRYDPGGFARPHIEVAISIPPSDQARYAVIHTPSSIVGKGYTFRVEKAVYPPVFQWFGQRDTIAQTYSYLGSPETSDLSIKLAPSGP